MEADVDGLEPALVVRDLSAVFRNGNGGLQALDHLSFFVQPQEFLCVLGPSGSGKSTLLRILAGLLEPTDGEVIYLGERLTSPRREIGFVFQKANLMPWRTVMQNILLPLEVQGVAMEDARGRARELVELVGLQGFEDTLPRDLSGAEGIPPRSLSGAVRGEEEVSASGRHRWFPKGRPGCRLPGPPPGRGEIR